jgi:hypothetical protein
MRGAHLSLLRPTYTTNSPPSVMKSRDFEQLRKRLDSSPSEAVKELP